MENKIDLQTVILNAHRLLAKKYKKVPLWSFVVDVCGVGSATAIETCREFNWNPHQDGALLLKRKPLKDCPRCGTELGTGLTLVPTVACSDEGTCSYGSGEFKRTVKCHGCGYSRANISRGKTEAKDK